MSRKRALTAGVGVAVVAVAVAALAWAGAGASAQGLITITVIEHATTDKVVDNGREGDSTGDLLTFHNKVYDDTDTTIVGKDQGTCVRVYPKRGTWECSWTTFLEDGQITVQGPFFDAEDTTLAITGGTGAYAAARGSMEIQARPDGTYVFVFNLLP